MQTTAEGEAKAADVAAAHLTKQLTQMQKLLTSRQKDAGKLETVGIDSATPPCNRHLVRPQESVRLEAWWLCQMVLPQSWLCHALSRLDQAVLVVRSARFALLK